MSLYGAFDQTKHLSELGDPLDTQEGVLTPTQRRDRMVQNLTGDPTATVAQLLNSVAGFTEQAAPAAKTTSTTLTAAELLGGLITGNQGAAGAADYTLPLGTAMETALAAVHPSLAVGTSFDFTVINLSVVAAEDITLLTAAGWTLVGSMIVIEQTAANPAGSTGRFRVRRTAANTYTLYRIT